MIGIEGLHNAAHPYMHDFTPPLGFLFVWGGIEREKKNAFKRFSFLSLLKTFNFMERNKIFTECMC